MMANINHGSSGKVTDIEKIKLPPFAGIYDLVNDEIQFQDVRECAFINNLKGGLKVVYWTSLSNPKSLIRFLMTIRCFFLA